MRILVLAAALLLGIALAVVSEDAPRAGQVVARVGSQVVTGADLAGFLYERQRESWLRTVDDLVDETIVRSEARRLGVSVPPAAIGQAVQKEVEAREKQLKQTFGDDVTLSAEVQRAYGLDVAAWRRDVIRPRVGAQLLLMRIVRLDTRRRPRVKVRVIVLDTEERARMLLRKLQTGADFSLLAVQESVDPTAKGGGDLPAIARGDLTWPEVERHLFQGQAGQVLGPLQVADGVTPRWHLYKVIQQLPAWDGTRGALLIRLEKDLKDHPLERAEFERWRARMRRDFQVQVLSPDGKALRGS